MILVVEVLFIGEGDGGGLGVYGYVGLFVVIVVLNLLV